jgi:hypothetical protein
LESAKGNGEGRFGNGETMNGRGCSFDTREFVSVLSVFCIFAPSVDDAVDAESGYRLRHKIAQVAGGSCGLGLSWRGGWGSWRAFVDESVFV